MGSPLACRVDPNQPECGQPQLVSDSRLAGSNHRVSASPPRQKKDATLQFAEGQGIIKTGKGPDPASGPI